MGAAASNPQSPPTPSSPATSVIPRPRDASPSSVVAARDADQRESGDRRSGHSRSLSREWVVQWTQSAADAVRSRLRLSQERRPEVPRYVVVGVTGVAVLSVLTGFGANNISNFAGFVYPLYMSWKAVRTVDAQDDTQWLTYWVVYGFLNVCESWTRMFGLTALPFYSALKVCFLLWCFHPRTRGADVIFHRIITPLLLKYEQRIDRFARWWVGETQAAANDMYAKTSTDLQRRVSKFSGDLIRAFSDVAAAGAAGAAGAAAGASAAAGSAPSSSAAGDGGSVVSANASASGAAPAPASAFGANAAMRSAASRDLMNATARALLDATTFATANGNANASASANAPPSAFASASAPPHNLLFNAANAAAGGGGSGSGAGSNFGGAK